MKRLGDTQRVSEPVSTMESVNVWIFLKVGNAEILMATFSNAHLHYFLHWPHSHRDPVFLASWRLK